MKYLVILTGTCERPQEHLTFMDLLDLPQLRFPRRRCIFGFRQMGLPS